MLYENYTTLETKNEIKLSARSIKYVSKILHLNCGYNQITTLDLRKNTALFALMSDYSTTVIG